MLMRRRNDPPLRRSLRPRGPVQFELAKHRKARLSILELRGELDILTAPRLATELHAIVRRTHGDLVIDLREAVFIDSAGLYVLLNVHRRLDRAGRKLTVVCDEGPVKRVIELARLDETLGVTTSIDEHDPADVSSHASSR
jgi:anti-sigma B factor antagonist